MQWINGQNNQDGRFTERHPAGNQGTQITADWLNDVQDALMSLLDEANINPTTSGSEHRELQVLKALKTFLQVRTEKNQPQGYAGLDSSGKLKQNIDASKITSGLLAPERGGVPTGSIFWFAKKDAPQGFLYCNGADISKSAYSALYAVIGNAFGNASNNNKFRLPELRERFIRGYGENTFYAGRFGAYQSDALDDHYHYIAHSSHYHAFQDAPVINAYNHLVRADWGKTDFNQYILRGQDSTPDVGRTSWTKSANTASETRPKNITLLPCIKY